jgi:digeranylgeranylglycerophospholipid reductase
VSSQFYDVIIVGAGPAGSWAAYELACRGHRVAVLEQKSAPGLDSCCTGIISRECFESLGVGPELILRKVNSARLFSPSGRSLRLGSERVQACIVDRASLDEALARKARAGGAEYFLSCRAGDVMVEKDGARVEVLHEGSREILRGRAIILAGGFRPGLSQRLGLGRIRHFIIGAQAEIQAHNIEEIEIYSGREIAPGSFAWLVPTSGNRVLAGLLAGSQAGSYLGRFLRSHSCRGGVMSEGMGIRQKAVPLGILPRSCGERLLVVGDAAGQVKPVTGGGIYLGHLGAKIAAEVLHGALKDDDLSAGRLCRYQKQWQARMGREISLGYRLRQVYGSLSDRRIERVFDMLHHGGLVEALLDSPDFSFDWHSGAVLAGFKQVLARPLRSAGRSSRGRVDHD